MDDQKNINLMPEDLRSKESEDKKINLQYDLVVPEKEAEAKKLKASGSRISLWQKLVKLFNNEPKVKTKNGKKPYQTVEAIFTEEIKKNGKHHPDIKESVVLTDLQDQEEIPSQEPEKIDLPVVEKPEIPAEKPEIKEEPISDYSLPKVEEDKPVSKFHQPEPRVRAKFIDNGGGVDLIPEATRIRSWKQIVGLLLVALMGSIIIIGLFYLSLHWQAAKVQSLQDAKTQQITGLEKDILKFEDLNSEIEELGKEIRLIDDLLNKHIYWTNFFALLEKYTVAEVYYTGFSAGQDGALTLNAVGTDYNAVARQLKVLQQEEAMEFAILADISAATLTEQGVEFSITLVLEPFLFYYGE